ncbi:MAG: hypothetical protein M1814_000915 [Vezdaea aestivalis]|nr:MAG: hypothetical protein M1814_000915 [Vezdaea aestivalis]
MGPQADSRYQLSPLRWLWVCHVCGTHYPLGATRRCLNDGHFFCSGTPVDLDRRQQKNISHGKCRSEFDYKGWELWAHQEAENSPTQNDDPVRHCWNQCKYPSQCLWERSNGRQKHLCLTGLETIKEEKFGEILELYEDGALSKSYSGANSPLFDLLLSETLTNVSLECKQDNLRPEMIEVGVGMGSVLLS